MLELNKIYNGDCIDFISCIDDKSIDMTITSPPYDNLRNYKGYNFNFEEIAKELYRVTRIGGVVVWIVGDATIKGSETGTSFKQALYFKEVGFNLHDTMIYNKGKISFPETNRYSNVFEYMFILSKGVPKTFNCIRDRKNKWFNGKKHIKGHYRNKDGEKVRHNKENLLQEYGSRFNIWEISSGCNKSTKDKIAFQHPAIFPEKLAEDHILSWSNEWDIVLDPMAGSGTTLKMAKKNNRYYIGIEISKEYCDICEKRLSENKLL